MSVVRMDGGGDRGYTGYWAAQSAGCWAGTTLPSPCHHLAITLPSPVCRRRSSAGRSRPRLPTLCSLQPELLCWSLCQSSSSCQQYVPRVTDGETVTGLKERRLLRRQTASNRLKFTVTSYNDFRTGVTVSRFC